MRVVVIIQARMGSTRLPGKVIEDLGGSPVLSWVVRACSEAKQIDGVVVATSTLPVDDAVADHARSLGVPVVRGSEDDVLSRYVAALDAHPCDAIVRITADCPYTDPHLIDMVVAAWKADPSLDYVSTVVVRTLPHGLDVELVTADALRRVDRTAEGHHRVHVTSGIYTAPHEFAVAGIAFTPDATDLRVTLDTPADLLALRAVVAELGDRTVSRRELVALLRQRPDIVALNADIAQKALDAG